jgi:hypothetical protein
MRPIGTEVDEEVLIERHPARRIGVDLHRPAADALGIVLLVPGGVERVGQVDPNAIADNMRGIIPRSRPGRSIRAHGSPIAPAATPSPSNFPAGWRPG